MTETPAPAAPLDESTARTYAILSHVGMIFFYFVAPLIFWLIGKDRSATVDRHGKEALNFSLFILLVDIVAWIVIGIGSLLMVIFIGFLIAPIGLLMLLATFVIAVIFGIQGAMAANRGNDYRYPMSIRFIK